MGDCIVDACVISSATLSANLDATACRSVLDVLRDGKHVVLIDSTLRDEWRNHSSGYSAMWFSIMLSRGCVELCSSAIHYVDAVDESINHLPAAQQPVARKDSHILSLSLTTGALVVSNEVRCRAAFVACGRFFAPIQAVYWASPLRDADLVPMLAERRQPPLHWLLI